KFTPRGGTVRVTLERAEGTAVLRVEDTGQGIDPAFLPALFQPFRQADPGRTRAHGGLGLGLALARPGVEPHGRHLDPASEGPGRGASFTVVLPIGGDAPVEEAGPEPLRVLFVGPEGPERELVRAVLDADGTDVLAVEGTPGPVALGGADVLVV